MLQNHQSNVHVGPGEAPSTLMHSFLTLSQRSESICVALPGVQKVASAGIGGTNPTPRSELAKPVKGGKVCVFFFGGGCHIKEEDLHGSTGRLLGKRGRGARR